MKNTTLHQRPNIQDTPSYDSKLFDALRTIRRHIAKEQEKDLYMIFSNRSLQEMAMYIPQSKEQLLQIHGVSEKKLHDYSEPFLTILKRYAAKYNVQPRTIPSKKDRKQRAIHNPHSTYSSTRALVEQGATLQEIAKTRNMKEGTIIAHIEELLSVYPQLDIEYLKPDKDMFNTIAAAFATCSDGKLTAVRNALDQQYSYNDLRLVRLFLTPTTL